MAIEPDTPDTPTTAAGRRQEAEHAEGVNGHGIGDRLARLSINARENWYRDLWLLVNTLAFCYVIFFALPSQVEDNTRAICALRHDLERRIAVSEEFLHENPHGSGGITPAVVINQIDGQKRTVQALRFVNCGGR